MVTQRLEITLLPVFVRSHVKSKLLKKLLPFMESNIIASGLSMGYAHIYIIVNTLVYCLEDAIVKSSFF